LQKELKRLFNRSNNIGSTNKGAVEGIGLGLGLGSSTSQISKNYQFLPHQNLSKWWRQTITSKHMTSGDYLSIPKIK